MTADAALSEVHPNFHPFLLVDDGTRSAVLASEWARAGLTVRSVSGRRARSLSDLLDEFAARLEFPNYFGHNKDAFNECIADLEGLPTDVGYVILITEPAEVLMDAGEADRRWLARSLAFAQREWAAPIERGEWWDRPALPFNVVLACVRDEVAQVRALWTAMGYPPAMLEGLV